jgi:hypothetical protein
LVNADFTDKEDMPSGIVAIHPANVQVVADTLPNNIFDYMIICPILKKKDGKEWIDDDFKGKELHVPQFSKQPVNLKTRNVETNQDAKYWTAEFGENDSSFAGIFKQAKGRDTQYFVGVQAGAPLACQQLREQLIRKPMSFKELLNSKEYMYCDYVALRNAQRLAYNVARSVNAEIKYHADIGSKVGTEYECPPWRADPKYTQKVSSIMQLGDGNVAIFNKVTPRSKITNNHFVYEGPYHGIAEFVMKNNTIGYGLPAHSGKIENPKKASNLDKRCQGIVCEKTNIKQHQDVMFETFKQTDDTKFKEAMKKYGWKSEIVQNNLIPVIIKVYDPNLKRK